MLSVNGRYAPSVRRRIFALATSGVTSALDLGENMKIEEYGSERLIMAALAALLEWQLHGLGEEEHGAILAELKRRISAPPVRTNDG